MMKESQMRRKEGYVQTNDGKKFAGREEQEEGKVGGDG